MAERFRRHLVTARLSDAERDELRAVRQRLGLSVGELLMIGTRHAAARYAAEVRRQRRQASQND